MKTIQYHGTANIQEKPITGNICLWYEGLKDEIEDSRAAALIAYSSDFRLDSDPETDNVVKYQTDPVTGGIVGLVGPDGTITSTTNNNPRLVILVGDSRTAQNYVSSTVSFDAALGELVPVNAYGFYTQDNGYAIWANSMMGGGIEFINAGHSGAVTSEMLTNLGKAITNHPNADEVWFEGGVNDVNPTNAFTDSTVVANILAAYELAHRAGMRFVWSSTILPTSAATGSSWTTTHQKNLTRANARLIKLFNALPGVDIVDAAGVFLDKTNANGWSVATNFYDYLHPNNVGAFTWGKAVAEKIQSRILSQSRTNNPLSAYVADSTSLQLVKDPLHLGSTGAASGTGVSGTVLSGLFQVTRVDGSTSTAVCSVVDSPDGIGKAQQLVVTASDAATSSFRIYEIMSTPSAALVAGKTFRSAVYVECTDVTGFLSVWLRAPVVISGASPTTFETIGAQQTTGPGPISNSGSMLLRISTDITLPAEMTSLTSFYQEFRLFFYGSGGGTFKVYGRECLPLD